MIIIDTCNNEILLSVNHTDDLNLQKRINKIIKAMAEYGAAPGVQVLTIDPCTLSPNIIIGDYGVYMLGYLNHNNSCIGNDAIEKLTELCSNECLTIYQLSDANIINCLT